MNNKRIYLILLVVGAILAVGAVIFYFLWPSGDGSPSTQPAPLPDTTPSQPFDPSRPPTFQPSDEPAPDINDPAERERQAQEALKRQALDFAARQGSYSSADEFSAIRQVYPQATSNLTAFLEEKRQSLIDRYPSFGPSFGITMRSLSAKIVSGAPIFDGTAATVEVQAQVVTNTTDGSENLSYEKVNISFVKSGSAWVADRVETEPLDL